MKAIILAFLCSLTLQSPSLAAEPPVAIGCGGYVMPVFPKSAGEDFLHTCWVARVKKDQMTDVVSCQIYPAGTKYDSYPFVYVRKNSVALSVAGGDRYPGTATMIRVDDHAAVTGGEFFNSSAAALLLTQMSTGSIIKTRFSEWPSNTYQDGVLDAQGFSEALDFCRAAIN